MVLAKNVEVLVDNMKTAVDRVRPGKVREVNARFSAMVSHYLFDAEFCNVASGWEKGQNWIEVSGKNPDRCTPDHNCGAHAPNHVHGPGCGHEPVPQGDHVDYLVNGHLHHPHGDHCDDHGSVELA